MTDPADLAPPTEGSPPPPSFVPGVRSTTQRRLTHRNRLLVGLAPILLLLALSPEAVFLRLLLVATFLLAIADLVLNPWLTSRAQVWADIPASVDLGVPTPVAVRVQDPSGAASRVSFVRGLESPPKLAIGAAMHGPLAASGLRRGVWETVALQLEGGGLTGSANQAIGFHLTPRQPLLVVPPSVADPAVDRWLEQLGADTEPETAGIRPFREGDRRRDVHWVSSARAGSPMVLDHAPSPESATRIEFVALAPNEATLVPTLGRARYATERARAGGWAVDLVVRCGAEGTDGVVRTIDVRSERTLLETLATAVPCGTARPPTAGGAPAGRARLTFDSEGLR